MFVSWKSLKIALGKWGCVMVQAVPSKAAVTRWLGWVAQVHWAGRKACPSGELIAPVHEPAHSAGCTVKPPLHGGLGWTAQVHWAGRKACPTGELIAPVHEPAHSAGCTG
jgi:hypothetical protein